MPIVTKKIDSYELEQSVKDCDTFVIISNGTVYNITSENLMKYIKDHPQMNTLYMKNETFEEFKKTISNVDNTHDKDKNVKHADSSDSTPWNGVTDKPSTFPPSAHTHTSEDIISLEATKLTGTIDIARLPQGALERCVVVENDQARFALTTDDAQTGDTVKVTSDNKMYFVVDDSKLSTEDGYTVYTAGTATSVPWTGVTNKPIEYNPSKHNHVVSEITDFPSSLPANGGNSSTVNGHTVDANVPSDAEFTDTIYVHPTGDGNEHVPANGTENDGKYLKSTKTSGVYEWGDLTKEEIIKALGYTPGTGIGSVTGVKGDTEDDYRTGNVNITPQNIGAAPTVHSHNYAGSKSAGGSAISAEKLDVSDGDEVNPVYFKNGLPIACKYKLKRTVSENTVLSYISDDEPTDLSVGDEWLQEYE